MANDSLFPDLPGAHCYDENPAIFYPDVPEGIGWDKAINAELWKKAYAPAKAICVGCPALQPCLSWALEHDEQGVWGGTDEDERAEIRRNQLVELNA